MESVIFELQSDYEFGTDEETPIEITIPWIAVVSVK
jgi:hypothetical protein